MRKVLSFVLVLAMILGSVSMVSAASFTDTQGKDYEAAASLLSDLDVIHGYKDGTFGGDKNVTRAEYVAMVVKALGFVVSGEAETGFKDVPKTGFAAAAIKYAKDLGITSGYSDGTFRPNANVTLDEAIAFTVRALGYKAEYLVGSYPTSYINVALKNGMLDGLKTGSVAATRGDIATLLYNTLNAPIIVYLTTDGAPSQINGDCMLKRLGAEPATTYAVITGEEDAVVDLAEYQGAYAKLYTNIKTGKVVGVYDVKSEFLTGKYDLSEDTFKVGDVEYTIDKYTYATAENANVLYSHENFVNAQLATSNIFTADGTYTIAAKVSGKHITDIYSVAQWVNEDSFAFAENDYDAKNATLKGYKLPTDKNDDVDATAFTLKGVASLADLKEDNVVTLYLETPADLTTKVVKIEVGTATVSGQVAEKVTKSGTDYYTIAGAQYAVDEDGDFDAVATKLGVKGTFTLTYAGKLFNYDAEETKAAYAVVLAHDAATGGIDKKLARVELLLANGEKEIYEVKKDYAPSFNDGDVVTFKLQDGKVSELTTKIATGASLTANTEVSKLSTINGKIVNANTIVFVKATDGTYSVGDAAKLADSKIEATYIEGTSNGSATGKIAVILMAGSANVSSDVYLVNSKTEVYDADGNYYKLAGFKNGEAVSDVLATVDTYTVGKLYKPTFNASGKITSFGTALTAQPTTVGTTKTAVSSDNKVFTDSTGANFTLDDAVVVYVKAADATTYTVSSVSALKGLTAGTVELYENRTTAVSVYNIVVITK